MHTYPVADLIEHELKGDSCICGPRVELARLEDDSLEWRVIHASLDGRELRERKA